MVASAFKQLDAIDAVQWSRDERAAMLPPVPMKCSEWAERSRTLGDGESNHSGPWKNANAPYLRGMMDVPFIKGVAEVALPKGAQIGASEAIRNVLGYIAERMPCPTALILPDKLKGEQIVNDRVLPMFRNTPVLQPLLTSKAHDTKKQQITLLNGFQMYLMWSGSPSSLKSNPIRVALADEVDTFQAFAGKDSDPISLIRKRLRSYKDISLLIKLSTPTTPVGPIWQEHVDADIQLFFVIECPKCGCAQRLVFDGIHWEKPEGLSGKRLAQHIVQNQAAWYECRSCHHIITDQMKRKLVRRGRWATCDDDGFADGVIEDAEAVERFPRGTRLSMHVSALYALWVDFADIAAEFIRAKGQLGPMFDFKTQTLGEAFEDQISKHDTTIFSTRSQAAEYDAGQVPDWADRLLMTIDSQIDHYWMVIRAWGAGMRSQRIHHARVESFDELDEWIYRRKFACVDPRVPAMGVSLAGIDIGNTRVMRKNKEEGQDETVLTPSRTMEIYSWLLERDAMVRGIKGDNKPQPGILFRRGTGTYVSGDDEHKLTIWLVDSNRSQDLLSNMIASQVETGVDQDGELLQADQWLLNQLDDSEYNQHMANLTKVAERDGHSLINRWVRVSSGARIDYRMCEAYQIALAYMAGINLLPGVLEWRQQRERDLAALEALRRKHQQQQTNPFGDGAWLATDRAE